MDEQIIPGAAGDPSTLQPSQVMGNAPELVISGGILENRRRTIADTAQAMTVVLRLEEDARNRNGSAALIQEEINRAPPNSRADEREKGRSWKTNFSTGYLASQVSAYAPRLYMRLKTAQELTSASLPPETRDSASRSLQLRRIFTRGFRRWSGSHHFIQGLGHEVASFGVVFGFWMDPIDWRPTLIRQDMGFVPTGTLQGSELDVFCAKVTYSPHELVAKIVDLEAASQRGWDVEEVVKSVNAASPLPVSSTPENARQYSDLVRQSVASLTYIKEANVVDTRHLLYAEADGRISYRILDRTRGATIFLAEDLYSSMEQAVVPVLFERGDGTIYGSLGLGQLLYGVSRLSSVMFSASTDNTINGSKPTVRVPDPRKAQDVKLTINSEYVVLSGDGDTINDAYPDRSEAFRAKYEMLMAVGDRLVGSYVPRSMPESRISASMVNAMAMREDEVGLSSLDNFLSTTARLFRNIFRRMADPASTDPIALSVRAEALKLVSEEELQLWANEPVIETSVDYSDAERNRVSQYLLAVRGNPMYDQQKVEYLLSEREVGEDISTQILLPSQDPVTAAEAERQQLMENTDISQGVELPVSARDNHMVHMPIVDKLLVAAIESGDLQTGVRALTHFAAHYEMAVSQKLLKSAEQINGYKSYINTREKQLQEMAAASSGGVVPPGDSLS